MAFFSVIMHGSRLAAFILWQIIIKYTAVIFSAILFISFIEHSIHRFCMHWSIKSKHTQTHHAAFHPSISFTNKDKKIEMPLYVIFMYAFTLLIAWQLFSSGSTVSGVVFSLSGILYTLWVEYIHHCFHRAPESFVTKLSIYKRLCRNHLFHHTKYNYNYGIGWPLWDILFQSYKKPPKAS